jgi:hypothetical protein
MYNITLNFLKDNVIPIAIDYVAFGSTYEEAVESVRLLAEERISIMGGSIISII